MLEPVKEQLEVNEEGNEIAGNTADTVYCPDGASTYSSVNSSDNLGSDCDDLNQPNEKNIIVFESQLNKLFLFCQQCESIVIVKNKTYAMKHD